MSEWISRPPFDEKGYAGGVIPDNKKKRKIWRWLLPALICVAIVIGVLMYRQMHSPEVRCYVALSETFAHGLGYESPLFSEMDLRNLVKMVQTGKIQADWKVSLESSNIDLAETDLADYVDSGYLPNINLLAGMGIRSKLSVYGTEATSHNLYVSYGALAFPVSELYVSGDKVAFSVPELSNKVLSIAPSRLVNEWDKLPQWDWVDANWKENVQNAVDAVKERIPEVKQNLSKGSNLFDTIYEPNGEFQKELLHSFSVEKISSKKENAVRHLYVGGKKQVCQGYVMRAESKVLTEKVLQILGQPEDAFRLTGNNSDAVEMIIYITKGGELALLDFECVLWVGEKQYPVQIVAELTGKKYSVDDFVVTVSTGEEKSEIFTIKRSLVRKGKKIEGNLQAKVTYDKFEWNGELEYDLDTAKHRMECEMSHAVNKNVWGTVSFEVTFASDSDQWKATVKKLKFTDPGNGNYVSVNTNLTIDPITQAPSAPKGTELDVFNMTEDDLKKIKEEINDNIQSFVKLFDKLF